MTLRVPTCPPGSHCVTCSDEGLPMRVLALAADGLARCVDDDGHETEVEVALVGPLAVGDHVLVHGGTALLRIAAPSGADA